MSDLSIIRDGIIRIARQGQVDKDAFSAEVLSVDVAARTCKVRGISDEVGVEYDNVCLMPEVDDGILYVPKVGSTVIVQNNANLQPYVSMWSELEQSLTVVGDTTFTLENGTAKLTQGKMEVTLTGGKVSIKNNSKDFGTVMENILKHIIALTVSTGTGPSSPPINAADFTADITDLKQLLG